MATSSVPAFLDALVESAGVALPDVIVSDGYGVTDDPGDFLMIGVEDPDSQENAFSVDVRQEWANANYTARNEDGEVVCAAVSWNGDGDQKLARDSVYDIFGAIEDTLRANPSLGVASLLWSSVGSSSQLSQAQGQQGAAAMLIFRIQFKARI